MCGGYCKYPFSELALVPVFGAIGLCVVSAVCFIQSAPFLSFFLKNYKLFLCLFVHARVRSAFNKDLMLINHPQQKQKQNKT
jgi:hypothetical protein